MNRPLCALRFALCALLLTACSPAGSGSASGFRGVAVATPMAKPAIVLKDVNGQPYDFVERTRDKVALLFFGYTHCPDVCPLHMANIAAVLRRMPAEDRARVTTVFVTTDPERDTPGRLREWLGNFDPSFVALTGTKEEIVRAQQSLGLAEATKDIANADSAKYFVNHAAQVFAFARDGMAYLVYPFGIRQEDWANDLPKLVSDASGTSIRRILAAQAKAGSLNQEPNAGASDPDNAMVISRAFVAEPASTDEAAAYITFRNGTQQEDTLVAIASDIAVRGEVHETMGEGEMRHMMAMPNLVLPVGAEVKLHPGGMHMMLLQLRRKLVAGDTVSLYLSLARAGAAHVRAPVVPYADLERVLGLSPEVRK
jgi:protein SCO1/2